MSDSTDDVDWYDEDYDDDRIDLTKLIRKLEKIAYADLDNFKNEQHMINYMKKMTKIIMSDLTGWDY